VAEEVDPQQVLTKVMQKLNRDVAEVKQDLPRSAVVPRTRRTTTGDLGIRVEGIEDVAIRIPQCCRPVPGDDVVGYISLGKGITVHRRDCPNVRALEKNPERFTPVHWDTAARAPFRVEIQVEAYDRSRLLEDISRTLAESGVNILAAQIHTTEDNIVRDRFVFEVPGVDYLETVLQRIRRIDTVYDAYRVVPH
ncbi:MAG: ACT domain-containing protein, partial [Actinobacteria bacterium]|nr:ACT domain-containing protein [Actinomycetota bacterium]